jgi:peptide-methionine (R)-S-oxide reductase
MDRRTFVLGVLAAGAAAWLLPGAIRPRLAALAAGDTGEAGDMGEMPQTPAGTDHPEWPMWPDKVEPIQLSEDEWRKLLPPDRFGVLRKEDTEPAGSSPLNHEHREGTFACAGCGLALFTSDMKYDSGTGWPSFFRSVDGHTATKRDFRMILPRTEYHCARCGGHQGHRFNDGPQPTGQRWCNNGLALIFIPKADAPKAGAG